MSASSLELVMLESSTSSIQESSSLGGDYFARQIIFNSEKKQSEITGFYKAVLRNLKTLFSGFYIQDSQDVLKNIKCVHGLSERAIAKQLASNSLVLPLVSVKYSATETKDSQRRFNATYTTETKWDDKTQRAIRIISLVPKPITIEYTLSVWTTYLEQLDQITEQIQRMFNPFIEVNLPYTKYGIISLSDAIDDIEEEVADQADRTLIRNFTIIVETHIPSPKYIMTNTGAIEYYNVEGQIYDAPAG